MESLPSSLKEATQLAASLFDDLPKSLSSRTSSSLPALEARPSRARVNEDFQLKSTTLLGNKENFDPSRIEIPSFVSPLELKKSLTISAETSTSPRKLSQEQVFSLLLLIHLIVQTEDLVELNMKRKRDDEEWDRVVCRKIETERELLKATDSKKEKFNKELYGLYNSLQCIATEYVFFSSGDFTY
jgi:hypothetical protein